MRACTMRLMENPHPLFSRATEPTCPNCGFSLHGLPESGACPECGRSYTRSSARAFVPPTLSRALYHIGLPLAIALLMAVIGVAIAAQQGGSSDAPLILGFASFTAGIACIAWAAWRAGTLLRAIGDTRPTETPGARTTSVLARAGMVVAVLIFIGAVCTCVACTLVLGGCLIDLGR